MITFKEAKRLSEIKWEYTYNNDGKLDNLLIVHPELEWLLSYCGFCQKYFTFLKGCNKCPMRVKGKACDDFKHPFYIWVFKNTKENALAVLKLVRKAKERK